MRADVYVITCGFALMKYYFDVFLNKKYFLKKYLPLSQQPSHMLFHVKEKMKNGSFFGTKETNYSRRGLIQAQPKLR